MIGMRSTRGRRGRVTVLLTFVTATIGCASSPRAASPVASASSSDRVSAAPTSPDQIRALLSALADDSMQGRATATPGYARAAAVVALEMQRIGLEPAGDSGYFQRVPIAIRSFVRVRPGTSDTVRFTGPTAVRAFADLDTVSADRRRTDMNVVGLIRGGDAAARDSVVVVGAHLDHVGVGRPVAGDSIYNGADDDASGVVAVLGIARALKQGPAPRRTVIFVAFTGEEVGGIGSRWYLAHPVAPLDRTVAQLQVEMIGRPDSLAGGSGRAWLTGYERSSMGQMLRAAGVPIVADPRPQFDFFRRSDNIAFAYEGIPAHTLSSYNLHDDYHQPSDEIGKVDFAHMAAVIDAAARATRLLADGPAPQWVAGGRPQRTRP